VADPLTGSSVTLEEPPRSLELKRFSVGDGCAGEALPAGFSRAAGGEGLPADVVLGTTAGGVIAGAGELASAGDSGDDETVDFPAGGAEVEGPASPAGAAGVDGAPALAGSEEGVAFGETAASFSREVSDPSGVTGPKGFAPCISGRPASRVALGVGSTGSSQGRSATRTTPALIANAMTIR